MEKLILVLVAVLLLCGRGQTNIFAPQRFMEHLFHAAVIQEDDSEVLKEDQDENEIIPIRYGLDEDISRCQEVLGNFIRIWNTNRPAMMLDYCSPAWKEKQTGDLKTSLFLLLANRTPLSYIIYDINVQGDTAIAEVEMLTDRNNGKEPVNYLFEIELTREEGNWYVNPESLVRYRNAQNAEDR